MNSSVRHIGPFVGLCLALLFSPSASAQDNPSAPGDDVASRRWESPAELKAEFQRVAELSDEEFWDGFRGLMGHLGLALRFKKGSTLMIRNGASIELSQTPHLMSRSGAKMRLPDQGILGVTSAGEWSVASEGESEDFEAVVVIAPEDFFITDLERNTVSRFAR